MSLFRAANLDAAAQLLGERSRSRKAPKVVTTESSLRHSAVWACRRLRGDLISTMPVDVFRKVDGVQVEMPKPPIFVTPGGDSVDWSEWCYSTQDDLDGSGNTVGVITARDGSRLPTRIELVPLTEVTFRGKGSRIKRFIIGGEKYDPADIWHEKQFTRSGLPVGLSPIAYAAMGIGGYLSAQEFARDWFLGGGIPSARLRNSEKTILPAEADVIKKRFQESVSTGDLFVTGKDWEYEPIQAKASESAFIEQMNFSLAEICRYLGVPADMIDASSPSGNITYANITQRNLQLLIINLNPAMRRREMAFSLRLLPQPRYMRFNRAGLLAMDLKTRYEAHSIGINNRFIAPSEVRTIEDMAPFTPEQIEEFSIFSKTPTSGGTKA